MIIFYFLYNFSHHNCLETEVKLKNYVKNLKEYLDNLDNKYSERKK